MIHTDTKRDLAINRQRVIGLTTRHGHLIAGLVVDAYSSMAITYPFNSSSLRLIIRVLWWSLVIRIINLRAPSDD